MTDKELIKTLLVGFQERIPFEGLHNRELKIPINTGKIITIPGVRRCGKSTLMQITINLLLKKGLPAHRIAFINFDDERVKFNADNLDLIIQAYRELYPKEDLNGVYFFFDEIQMADDWEPFVRRLYEQISKNVFITGSNSKLLSSELASSLRGRSLAYEEFPLSFAELCDFKSLSNNTYSERSAAKLRNAFDEFLIWGAFPEVVKADKELRNRILAEYYYVMLYRDLVDRFKITNISATKYFISRVMENVSSPTSVNKILNELKSQGYKASKELIYDLSSHTQAIYLFFVLTRYAPSLIKESTADKKFYCIDSGLRSQIVRTHSNDSGKMLENAVFLHLRRNVELGDNIYYYRGKHECDFLVERKSQVTQLVQVTWEMNDISTRHREINGLLEASDSTGCDNLTIVTHDEEGVINIASKTIRVIPGWKWMLDNR
ncbi:MAG: ATP-binding protein [Muribaculaceae bacterium]|nr:ATP-binding protein [Muribaculaceae bacterium]